MTLSLYPYQQKDLEFLSGWGRSANFSEPGVGKTPTAVRLIQVLEGLPCLIVCPASVKYHWQKEIEKFWIGRNPTNYHYGNGRKSIEIEENCAIFITSYEMFRKDFDTFFSRKRFKLTIFDEAHRLKNPRAKVTNCAYQLNTEFIHLITGTPITNQFDDLYSYFHLLFPDQFKNYWQFIYRYGIVGHNGFGKEIKGLDPKKGPQLAKLLRQFSVRHTKKEVLPQLPDKTYQTIEVDLLPRQRRIYDELKMLMMAELESGVLEVPNLISQMMKLRQIALSTELIEDRPASAKLDALKELLADRILAKKKTVVMSEFRRWIDIVERELKAKGIRVVRITGSENVRQREQAKKEFQEGDADVILCTIKAAGVGIDLTAADMCIFTDKSWTDVDNRQAEDRIHRASQTKKVQIVSLFARDTLDGTILDRNIRKALIARKLLDEDRKRLQDLLSTA